MGQKTKEEEMVNILPDEEKIKCMPVKRCIKIYAIKKGLHRSNWNDDEVSYVVADDVKEALDKYLKYNDFNNDAVSEIDSIDVYHDEINVIM